MTRDGPSTPGRRPRTIAAFILSCLALSILLAGCGRDDSSGVHFPVGPDRITLFNRYDSRNPSWSADGSRIVFDQDGDLWSVAPGSWIEARDAPEPDRLTDLDGAETEASWHPDPSDGRLAFVHKESDLYSLKVLDTADGSLTTVYSSAWPIREPKWTYSGGSIAFILHGTSSYGVYLIDPDGGGEPSLIPKHNPWYPVVHLSGSPSKPIVWYVEQTGVENVFSIPLEGGLSQIYSASGNSNNTFGGIAESKDGAWLAVSTLVYNSSTASWASALYRIKTFPPSPDWMDAVQLAINMWLSDGTVLLNWVAPDWSPDRRRIACGVRLDYWDGGVMQSKWDIAVIRLD